MGFQEVVTLETDDVVTIGGKNKKTNKDNPKSIEGYYLGRKEIPDRKKKSGIGYIHVFQTPKGNTGVWGKTDMDRKLLSVYPGTMARVEHTGFKETPNGDMYVYKISVDLDNQIDVPESSEALASRSASDVATDDSYTSEEPAYDDTPDLTTVATGKSQAERTAEARALLGRNRKTN